MTQAALLLASTFVGFAPTTARVGRGGASGGTAAPQPHSKGDQGGEFS